MRVLLLHSALGMRAAVENVAAQLRGDGHEVRVPDLYDGARPKNAREGLELRERIGREGLITRAAAAAEGWESFAGMGFSLGASTAQRLAARDARVSALLLLHGTGEVTTRFDMPVQLHVADPDPFEDPPWIDEWSTEMLRAGAELTVVRYPGVGHLFTDYQTRDYDEAASTKALGAVRAFLTRSPKT